MLGYDISWAIFNIIEVMSSNKFTFKRIGYLAASQSFHADSELLMLTTNMIRKDLNAQNQYEAGLALSGLSCFISHDLARDLANDIMTLVCNFFPIGRASILQKNNEATICLPTNLVHEFRHASEKLFIVKPCYSSRLYIIANYALYCVSVIYHTFLMLSRFWNN